MSSTNIVGHLQSEVQLSLFTTPYKSNMNFDKADQSKY